VGEIVQFLQDHIAAQQAALSQRKVPPGSSAWLLSGCCMDTLL
jgi:hypothetical protein